MRCYILDDVPLSAAMAASVIGKLHTIECQAVHDSTALKALFAKAQPELLVLDYHLPGQNGLDLLLELQALYDFRRTCTIFLTHERDPKLALACLRHGVADYVTKPFDSHALRQLACRLIDQQGHINSLLDEENTPNSPPHIIDSALQSIDFHEALQNACRDALKYQTPLSLVCVRLGPKAGPEAYLDAADLFLMRCLRRAVATLYLQAPIQVPQAGLGCLLLRNTDHAEALYVCERLLGLFRQAVQEDPTWRRFSTQLYLNTSLFEPAREDCWEFYERVQKF
jgi:CheY-like chemotaxis protein